MCQVLSWDTQKNRKVKFPALMKLTLVHEGHPHNMRTIINLKSSGPNRDGHCHCCLDYESQVLATGMVSTELGWEEKKVF